MMERVATVQAASRRTAPDAWIPQAELSRQLGLPAPTLGQIVHKLRKAGLLDARRGPSGGIRLARPSAEIAVIEVVTAIDGVGIAGRCLLGFPQCSDQTPCPVHPVWKTVRPRLERQLEQRSIRDLARAVARAEKRPAGRG